MTYVTEPTRIKQSYYLLVPKAIANLLSISDDTKLSLNVKKIGNKNMLEYQFETS